MAEDVDQFIKNFLNERYQVVLETLRTYKGAIESMVASLYETETIEGKKVVEIIKNYEEKNGMKGRLKEHESANDDIKEALKKDQEKEKPIEESKDKLQEDSKEDPQDKKEDKGE